MQEVSSLIVTPLPDGVNWELIKDFKFLDDQLGLIVVPAGFVTDFGSVPEALRNLISPTGKGTWGFVLHDWFYGTQTIPRADADRLLLRVIRFYGENPIESDAIFEALRIAGEIAWREDEPKIPMNLALLKGVSNDGRIITTDTTTGAPAPHS